MGALDQGAAFDARPQAEQEPPRRRSRRWRRPAVAVVLSLVLGLSLLAFPTPVVVQAAAPSEPVRGFSPSGVARVASDIEQGWTRGTTISRNGKKVGYLDENLNLVLVDRSGNTEHYGSGTNTSATRFAQPTLDADGDRVAFTFQTYDQGEEEWDSYVELIDIEDNSIDREVISTYPNQAFARGGSGNPVDCAERPSISSSGRWVAMLYRDCDDEGPFESDYYEEGIHVWNDEPPPTFTAQSINSSYDPAFVVAQPATGYGMPQEPQITPDAGEIAFQAPLLGSDPTSADLFVIDTVGDPDGATNLTSAYEDDDSERADSRNPSPSNDGDLIAFSSNATNIVSLPTAEQGKYHTYVLNRDPTGTQPPSVSLVSPYGTDEPTFPVISGSGLRVAVTEPMFDGTGPNDFSDSITSYRWDGDEQDWVAQAEMIYGKPVRGSCTGEPSSCTTTPYDARRPDASASGEVMSFTSDFAPFGRPDLIVPNVYVFQTRVYRGALDPDAGWSEDPVNVGTGHYVDHAVDLEPPEGVFGPTMERSYSSADDRHGLLGVGWTTPLDTSVRRLKSDRVEISMPDGRAVQFDPQVGGGYAGPPDVPATLTWVTDHFRLDWDGGSRWVFTADGLLDEVHEDPDASQGGQRFEVTDRDTEGRPEEVTTLVGSQELYQLTLGYEDGILASVTGSDGRIVEYDHEVETGDDPLDDLESVHLARAWRPRTSAQAPADVGYVRYELVDGRIEGVIESMDASTTPAEERVKVRLQYTPAGQVAVQESMDGTSFQYHYDLAPNPEWDAQNDPPEARFEEAFGTTTVEDLYTGELTVYAVDEQGRLVEMTDSTGESSAREYTGEHRTRVETRDGEVYYPVHDAHGRIKYKVMPDPTTGLAPTPTSPTAHPSTYGATRYEEYTYVAEGTSTVDHRVLSVRNAAGEVMRFRYDDADQQPDAVTTAYGTPLAATTEIERGTDATSGSAGQVVEEVDADGVRTTYTYDEGRRASETVFGDPTARPGGETTTYDVVERGEPGFTETDPRAARVETVTTPLGAATPGVAGDHTTVTVFDSAGRVIAERNGLTGTTVDGVLHEPHTYTYYDTGELQSETDAAGGTTTYEYSYALSEDPWPEPEPITRVERVTDPDGVVTETRFDRAGDMVEERTFGEADGPGDPVSITTHTYGDLGRLLHSDTLLDDDGTEQRWVRTSYEYDEDGKVTETTVGPPDLSPGERAAHTTTTAYNKLGWVTEERTPASDGDGDAPQEVTTYTYDALGRETSRTTGAGTAAATMVGTAYDAAGRKWREVLHRGTPPTSPSQFATPALDSVVTEYDYTPGGRIESVTGPPLDVLTFDWNASGTQSQKRSTTYAYDPAGRVRQMTLPGGTVMGLTYDLDGRQTRTDRVVTSGSTTTRHLVEEVRYDQLGNRTHVTTPWKLSGSTLLTATAVSTWDPMGRLLSETDPHQCTTTLPACTSSPHASRRTFTYTDGGRMQTSDGPESATVTYEYDGRGNKASAAVDLGAVTSVETWGYDAAGNLVAHARPHDETDTAPPTTTYGYDDFGRLGTVTDPTGRVEQRTWTNSGRVKAQQYRMSSGAPVSATSSFAYDARGRMVEMVDGTGTTTVAYDRSSNITSLETPAHANPMTYEWSLGGTRRTTTYPSGGKYRFSHNARGQMLASDVNLAAQGQPESWFRIGTYEYQASTGWMTREILSVFAGAGTRQWTHNAAGQAITFAETVTDSGGTTTYNATMDWRADRRLGSEQVNGGTTKTYTYDDAGQLTGAGSQTFAYGLRGERTQQVAGGVTTTYETDPGTGHLLEEVRDPSGSDPLTTVHAHDDAGRRTTTVASNSGGVVSEREAVFDARGLADTVTYSDPASTLVEDRSYDGGGVPVASTLSLNGGTPVPFNMVWDRAQDVSELAEAWSGSTLVSRMNYGVRRLYVNTTTVGWYAYDHHGSVIDTVNTEAPTSYDPFGVPVGGNGLMFGYRGEVTLNGDVHLRNRDYDPHTGLFLSPDPLEGVPGTPTETNPWHYADNDPVNKVDPLGLRPNDLEQQEWCLGLERAYYLVEDTVVNDDQYFDAGTCIQACQGDDLSSRACRLGDDIVPIAEFILTVLPFYDCYATYHDPNLLNAGLCLMDIIPGVGKLDEILEGGGWVAHLATKGDEVAGAGGRHGDEVLGSGARCSFSADTPVLMADGTTKPISQVVVGDVVLATDPETGESGPREVVATLPHLDRLSVLRTSAGDIGTTEDHRYWNATDQAWQEAQDIDAGEQLLSADGDAVTVEGLDRSDEHVAYAYDLTVADLHTFYVGAGDESVLVHNSFCPRPGTALYNSLNSKLQKFRSYTGNYGVAGRVSADEADWLGREFVGEGYTVTRTADGTSIYVSADRLRQYRAPSAKNTSYSLTGYQANFQRRSTPRGGWEHNGHIDVNAP